MHTGEAPRAAGRMRGLPGSGERAASGTENKGAAKKGKLKFLREKGNMPCIRDAAPELPGGNDSAPPA